MQTAIAKNGYAKVLKIVSRSGDDYIGQIDIMSFEPELLKPPVREKCTQSMQLHCLVTLH